MELTQKIESELRNLLLDSELVITFRYILTHKQARTLKTYCNIVATILSVYHFVAVGRLLLTSTGYLTKKKYIKYS